MSAEPQPAITELSPEEFAQLADPPLLIDVRSNLEYRMGHAPGAINLSMPRILMGMGLGLQRWFLPSWFRQLASDRPIACMCLTSHRSPIVAKSLSNAGFTQVFNISGGMMAWNQANLPVETGNPNDGNPQPDQATDQAAHQATQSPPPNLESSPTPPPNA